MKNLTPVDLRCEWGGCPSVRDPEDGSGDLIIVGKKVDIYADVVNAGEDEHVIRINRKYLADALK